MSEFKQGHVSITLPEGEVLPESAGKLTANDRRRLPKARRGVGAVCDATADDIERAGDRISVPGVTPEALRAAGRRADLYEPIIADLTYVLAVLRDANTIVDGEAHELLRQVLAELRAREKFDPGVTGLLTNVVRYFKIA